MGIWFLFEYKTRTRKLSVTAFPGFSALHVSLGYSGFAMHASPADHAQTFVWSYVFGPFLAFLPARLRAKWFASRPIDWRRATILSGILQLILTPIVLLLWMVLGISRLGASTGIGGGAGPVQTFYVFLLDLNPITWLILYQLVEGFARIFAASLLDETPGTFVLFALDQFHLLLNRKFGPPQALVADLVTRDDARADWQLKIESSRAKRDWNVGRLLRYNEHYYRIESSLQESGARPHVFLLRSLAAGVPSYSVILYSPETADAPHPAFSPQNS